METRVNQDHRNRTNTMPYGFLFPVLSLGFWFRKAIKNPAGLLQRDIQCVVISDQQAVRGYRMCYYCELRTCNCALIIDASSLQFSADVDREAGAPGNLPASAKVLCATSGTFRFSDQPRRVSLAQYRLA